MKALNKNIRREFKVSKGRFLSVAALLTLGIFVFVGLTVTGSNMRSTAQTLYQKNHLADAKVTASLPLNTKDKEYLQALPHIKQIEYGQVVDAVISGTNDAVRIETQPKLLSTFDLVQGRAPKNAHEIVLSSAMNGKFKLADEIAFSKPKENVALGLNTLTFKVVGFVHSSEYLKRDTMGSTRAGIGQLTGFSYVNAAAFTKDQSTVARLTFDNTSGVAYSEKYERKVADEVDSIQKKLTRYYSNRIIDLQKDRARQFSEGSKKIADAKNQIDAGKKQLIDANAQITVQMAQVKDLNQPQMLSQLEEKKKELANELASLEKKEQELIDQQNKQADAKKSLSQLSLASIQIQSRNDYNDGYSSYGEDTHRLDVLARIFPVFFFLIAVLVSFTTMRRMVEEKRVEMGSLRALGYSKREVMREFIVYSFTTAIIGTVVGSYLGLVFLPINIFKTYQANFSFEKIELAPHYFIVLLGFFIAFSSTVLASYTAARKELKTIPAQLMLPKPPAKGARILLERATPIWKRMTFSQKVTARNLFRYKGRMFMTILGVAGATALMITGFGIKDSLNTIADRQFGHISKFDLITSYNADDTKENVTKVENLVTKSDEVKEYLPAFFSAITTKVPDHFIREKVVLIVPEEENKVEEYVQLRDYQTGKKMVVNDEGAILSEKLAKIQKVTIGDQLTIRDSGGHDHQIKVAGITTMYAGHYIYMSPHYYQETFGEKIKNNSYLLKLKDNHPTNVRAFAAKFNQQNAAYDVLQAQESKLMITNILKNMDNLILVMVLSASMLSIIVLYTLTNVNVGERIRELSTLKVLGFYPKEVLFYIYRESNLLTGIGILVGLGVGYVLHGYIMEVMPPANAMVAPGLTWTNILLSVTLTTIFSVMVMIVMNRKIQKVDMLEALKSMD